MFEINYLAFFLFTASLNIVPGASVMYISSQTINKGIKSGLLGALALAIGDFILVIAIGLGFSELSRQYPMTIHIIKYMGAAYLFALGILQLIPRKNPLSSTTHSPPILTKNIKSLCYGIFYELLNPKLLILFAAFLPLFVNFDEGQILLQFSILGAIFCTCSFIVNSSYAALFNYLSNQYFTQGNFKKYAMRITGILMMVFGLGILFLD